MRRLALRLALVFLAAAAPAVAHHPEPVLPQGGPALVQTHDRLRAAAVRADLRVFAQYRPGTPWVIVRRRAAAYWRALHPEIVQEHRERARFPVPDWFITWLQPLRSCESGGDPRAVDPSGTYSSMYQFDVGTWGSVGGNGWPGNASEREQHYRAYLLWKSRGLSPWPVCRYRVG